ncbi:MAG TPA: outer membrane protein assembly factor BamA [Sphingomicrobium sp.]|nr:outer membrane protein assembly factor BamA [Sphingomicrobium sp.]
MAGTVLGGSAGPLLAQPAPAQQPATAQQAAAPPQSTSTETQQPFAQVPTAPASTPAEGTIRSITVRGNQRLEPETIRAYADLAPGQTYTAATLDKAIKALYATQLFASAEISGTETGNLVINVRENPVINRIILEGNQRLKSDKITPEIKLAPRQIFTPYATRADVDRILELYRRQGRFAAHVDPQIVRLDQNRVDVIFKIYEGPLAKVRAINILGNKAFSDDRLRKEMFTRQAGGLLGFIKTNDTYDPDRLAADQQKLRAFYLTEGYADFRVVSALAELTPDRRDFVITYVVDEGPRYHFGTVEADSALRDFPNAEVLKIAKVQPGGWFNAKQVEDAITDLNQAAGNLGYAFADISPAYNRDPQKKVMNITFKVGQTPRVYVERIDITGNTSTRDKVIRREFRLNEGDAFNALKVKRSQDRIQSLGFFSDKFEIKQTEGSTPDRVILGANVEEKATGQLSLSGGYSSLERWVIQLGLSQNNFMGKGQSVDASVNWSLFGKSAEVGFTDPYFMDKPILFGVQLYRRDYSAFDFVNSNRNTTYSTTSTGGGIKLGFPISEYWQLGTRYTLSRDSIALDQSTFFTDFNNDGILENNECDPLKAGFYLCDEVGARTTSAVGYSTLYDDTDGIHPTRGQQLTFSQDFAGVGGDIHYLRTQAYATKYKSFGNWILSLHGEGGYIHALSSSPGPGRDAIRLTDRFFDSAIRGFDIRGIGPRVLRVPYDANGNLEQIDVKKDVNDALGGKAYYLGRVEIEVPVSSGIKSLGLRPSIYVDAGSLWDITQPPLLNVVAICTPKTGTTGLATFQSPVPNCSKDANGNAVDPTKFDAAPGFKELFLGNSAKPRVSVGIGVNWISPFGPLRLDLAKALITQPGDDPKLFTFNVGTQF